MNRKQRRALKARGTIMSQEKPQEQLLREEHFTLCMQAGQIQYQIVQMERSLDELNKKIEDVNIRFSALTPASEDAVDVQPKA